MSSKITVTYDALSSKLSTIFSTKTRIPNAYSLADNNQIFLRDGYGLKINSTAMAESEFCNYAYDVEFGISLTREVLRVDSESTPIDVVAKLLLEDLKLLQDNLLAYSQLGQEASIEKIDFSGSSGIDFVEGDKFNFAALEAAFTITIRENL